MIVRKTGLPEEGEVVLCTVKKILRDSVFVSLDEFENLEGIIHISEVAAGRIRAILDYVREGKPVICKVIGRNLEHHSVNLSLRRVSDVQRQKKTEELKKEQKAEKMLEIAAKELKINPEEVFSKVGRLLIQEYNTLNAGLEEMAKSPDNILIKKGVDKKLATTITELVKQRVKPSQVKISRMLMIRNKHPDGIERIKALLKKVEDFAKTQKKEMELIYMGSPRYKLVMKAEDYKSAESLMKDLEVFLKAEAKKSESEAELIKESKP